MSKGIFRWALENGDNVVAQEGKKRFTLYLWYLFQQIFNKYDEIPDWVLYAVDYGDMSNDENEVEEELNKLADQFEYLLEKKAALKKKRESEAARINKSKNTLKNVGTWFIADRKDMPKGFKAKVNQDWKRILKDKEPETLGFINRIKGKKEDKGHKTAFTHIPADLKSKSFTLDTLQQLETKDTDVVVINKDDNKQQNQQGKGSRKKQSGESNECHQKRLKAMEKGTYNPDTWDINDSSTWII